MERMLPRRCAFILVAAAAAFLIRGCAGSSSHEFRLIYLSVSESSQEILKFTALGYADDQLVTRYDSNTHEGVPQVPWAKKLKEDIPEYWNRYTKVLKDNEQWFESYHRIIRQHYNHSKGFHTWQMMLGSEVSPHGSDGAYWTFGYDGKDFLSLVKENDTWIATDAVAQVIERLWETDSSMIPRFRFLVEVVFIDWLKKYEAYAKEALLQKEPPVVKVTRKPNSDGTETLICRAHGFYPKEINSTWRKDGEASGQDSFHGGVLPNSDGTYYNWLSIKINPKDRNHYWCHVEHVGLQKPVDVTSEEPGSYMGIITGCVLGAIFFLVALSAGIYMYITKKQGSSSSSGDQHSYPPESTLDLTPKISTRYRTTILVISEVSSLNRNYRLFTGGDFELQRGHQKIIAEIVRKRAVPNHMVYRIRCILVTRTESVLEGNSSDPSRQHKRRESIQMS